MKKTIKVNTTQMKLNRKKKLSDPVLSFRKENTTLQSNVVKVIVPGIGEVARVKFVSENGNLSDQTLSIETSYDLEVSNV